MKIAMAGYSGFIGRNVISGMKGYELVCLERRDLYGDSNQLSRKLEGCKIVMNFAGYSISKRWTAKNRKKIYESRVNVTRNLVQAINQMQKKPAMFINASAIGVYAFNEKHTEKDFSYGEGFLKEVVTEWEAAAGNIDSAVALVLLRFGMVLGKDGGAFPRLKRIFRMGLGGVIGSGKQVYSFIHVYDLVRAVWFIVENSYSGVFNLTSPLPVTNRQFSSSLAQKLNKRLFFRIPSFALKMLMGRASQIIIKGQTVLPERLLQDGFKFTFASIDEAFVNLLK